MVGLELNGSDDIELGLCNFENNPLDAFIMDTWIVDTHKIAIDIQIA